MSMSIVVKLCWLAVVVLLPAKSNAAGGVDSALLDHIKDTFPDWYPKAIIDVGANRGKYSTAARKTFPKAKIMMFEANLDFKELLEKKSKEIGNADSTISLLTETDGGIVTYYSNPRANTGNSIFKENSDHFQGNKNVKAINRTTARLDTLISKSFVSMDEIDIFKIDVQGAELLVLEGAVETLRHATFIQLEASTVEYNDGGSCLFEVDEFLRNHGFYFYHHADPMILPKLFKTYGVGQWDVLYVRPTSDRLPAQLKSLNPNYCGSGRPKKYISPPTNGNNNNNNGNVYYMENVTTTASDKFWSGWVWGLLSGGAIAFLILKLNPKQKTKKRTF